MIRKRHEQSKVPRPRSPGWIFKTRSIHLFIQQAPRSSTSLPCCSGVLRCGSVQKLKGRYDRFEILNWTTRLASIQQVGDFSRLQEHHLLLHVLGRELCAVLDFESRRPSPDINAAQHAGVDQEHLAPE